MSQHDTAIRKCFRCGSDNLELVSESVVYGMEEFEFGGENIYIAVVCKECGIIGPFSNYDSDSIESWNIRAEKSPTITDVSRKTTMISP